MGGSRDVDTALEPEPMRPAIAGGPCDECPPGRIARLVGAGRIVAGLVSFAAAGWWTRRAFVAWWRSRPDVAAWWRSRPDVGPGVELWPRDPASLPDETTFAGILRVDPLTPAEHAEALGAERDAALDSPIRL